MTGRARIGLSALACLTLLSSRQVDAQSPTIGPEMAGPPGTMKSSLGPVPGTGAVPFSTTPGSDSFYLGGRPGTSSPRVPTPISTPGGGLAPLARQAIAPPAPLAITSVPLYGPLEAPEAPESEGPPDGLTLDLALNQLLANNLYLRSNAIQVPKARADVLTASLRANPILYADSQLIPYGQYTRANSGGPQQYDVNVQQPIDLSHKRRARTAVAVRTVDVLEAQFQDVARLEIDNLYTAYVNVLAARETVRFARASIEGLKKVLQANEALFKRSNTTRPEVDRVRMLKDRADIGLFLAEETLRRTKRELATLLNIPPAQAESLELRGRVTETANDPGTTSELVEIALASRPDLVAQRLSVLRADAEIELARANRFADAYILYQPYTFQNNTPFGLKSATSWAVGATVPLPFFHRNQGGVLRSQLMAQQSRTEVAGMERRIVDEVTQALREYETSRDVVNRLERDVVPAARSLRNDTLQLFAKGELDALASYNAQKDYNEAVRSYRDMSVRHRRSMLKLNTAVGRRVLP